MKSLDSFHKKRVVRVVSGRLTGLALQIHISRNLKRILDSSRPGSVAPSSMLWFLAVAVADKQLWQPHLTPAVQDGAINVLPSNFSKFVLTLS